MLDFDKHIQDRSDERYAQMRFWADIDNACYDHAREVEIELRAYLQKTWPDIAVSQNLNIVTLTKPNGRALIISTQDHRTYELERPDCGDVRDQLRKTYPWRLKEDQMMDEVLEWLAIPAV
jgi:hypothetical protein